MFRLLENTDLGASAIGYHSTNLSQHEYKRVAELDFVITTRTHLLVLEVKGGAISCRDGIWVFTDRYGEEHRRSEGPFEQARSGMFSLEGRLNDELGTDVRRAMVVGFGVVFPDWEFDERSVGWDDELVMDADDLSGVRSLEGPLQRLMAYWTAKSPGRSGVSKQRYVDVGRLLRPDFDKVPSLRARTDALDLAMEELTEEQFRALDYVEDWDRLAFVGGAGTGKTFLAAEAARRHAAKGARVLYLCPRDRLAAFLRPRLIPSGVDVMTVDSVGDDPYDVLIVDEAQDLMNLPELERLDELIEGGLERGVWRAFLDPNRQHSVVGVFDADAFAMLKSFGAHEVRLDRNCRNTPQIVEQVRVYTGGDLGTAIAGEGPKVDFVDVGESPAEEALETRLRELIDENVSPGEITILSPGTPAESCVSRAERWRRGRIRVIDEAVCSAWPGDALTWASIEDFKGLENRFVILTDLHLLSEGERGVNQLYIGMSRPRVGLSLLLDAASRSRLAEMAGAVLGGTSS
ncbi:AAA family ATPase [Miltoncostaea marina]|uniref:AAA family ATPase n=1 Tax=Miltoncostaea marina TaxID=2843215 RepID=UPI001C3E5514